jgi:hypothetical protein
VKTHPQDKTIKPHAIKHTHAASTRPLLELGGPVDT